MESLETLARQLPWLARICDEGSTVVRTQEEEQSAPMGPQEGEIRELEVSSHAAIYDQVVALSELVQTSAIQFVNSDGEKVGEAWMEDQDGGPARLVTDFTYRGWTGWSGVAFAVIQAESRERVGKQFVLVYQISVTQS